MFCFGLYNNKTLYVLICAHFITLNLRHIVVKHLQQSASTLLHWVRDNIYLQSVILRNMSYFVLLTLVFHCKQLREQRILSSKSWMWATWVILPVNIMLNHQVLSWQRWLIRCWILLVSSFLTKMLQNGHLLGEQYIFKRVFGAFSQAAKILFWHQLWLKIFFPNRDTLAALLLFVILERKASCQVSI